MDVQAHTTPETRDDLRVYLRNRRLMGSHHQAVTFQTLCDLEEALRLLRGVQHPSEAWFEEVEAFLSLRLGKQPASQSQALPGLLEGA